MQLKIALLAGITLSAVSAHAQVGLDTSPAPRKGESLEPSPFAVAYNHGVKALDMKNLKLAEAHFLVAERFEPGSLLVKKKLGTIYFEQGRKLESWQYFSQIVQPPINRASSATDDPQVIAKYGDLSLHFKKKSEALWAYRAVAALPRYSDALLDLMTPRNDSLESLRSNAHLRAGFEASAHGDLESSAKHYRIAVDVDKSYWFAHRALAGTLWLLNDLVGAKAEFLIAKRLAPATQAQKIQRELERTGLVAMPPMKTLPKRGRAKTLRAS